MGVHVLDHIIIGKGRYVSFVEDGGRSMTTTSSSVSLKRW